MTIKAMFKYAVVGFGMTAQKFIEDLRRYDRVSSIVVFGDEPYRAYDRVNLTSYVREGSHDHLVLREAEWYEDESVTVILSRVDSIDVGHKKITYGAEELLYDKLILSTGSNAFVPSIKMYDKTRLYVYRTIEDIRKILVRIGQSTSVCVIGGGLLGLEAAKVCLDAHIKVRVVDRSRHLLSRQIDEQGSSLVRQHVEALGIGVYERRTVEELSKDGYAVLDNGETFQCDFLIAAAGIRPNDKLARAGGVNVHERGGIVVNDFMETSVEDVYAIGEVALHRGKIYGLVNPCYEQARVLAYNLGHKDNGSFESGDTSAKLKLLGIDVASFGQSSDSDNTLTYRDPVDKVYRKLIFDDAGKRLLGGVLVGDASDYSKLQMLSKSKKDLKCRPSSLLITATEGQAPKEEFEDDDQICSCNDVTKGDICKSVESGCETIEAVGKCTQAGTGCGGCKPLIQTILSQKMKELGKKMSSGICSHFPYSRPELIHIVKVEKLRTFRELLQRKGLGTGCYICRPAIASILSSVWNGYILDPKEIGLQDTNDRFLANLQRGGSYSIVPRVPGGEITPDKLIVIGEIAKEYGLYTKITGGQRIDLFGAEKHQLPEIWGKLVSAGFESGHAYGKALRTVKSCVGSSWCRFGMRDSVGFAILLENRYKGIRSPHKIKGGVSGCIRECAEARGKDFGLIAVEGGYNIYVCGNGGSKPKHAVLLVSSVSEEQCVKYLDRFIAFYITTADKLQRTARWLENLEGGIAYLRKVIVEDSLHIADSLEQHMDDLISTYKCEWKTALERDKRKQFDQFVNSEENQDGILKIEERGQKRPVDRSMTAAVGYPEVSCRKWVRVAKRSDFGEDSGRTVLYGKSQIAVFNFSSMGKWYATQNLCPHENALVLSQGLLSSTYDNGQNTLPTVACPMHKREYSLEGKSEKSFLRFPVMIDGDDIMLKLPSQIELDEVLATDKIVGTCKGCEDPLLKW